MHVAVHPQSASPGLLRDLRDSGVEPVAVADTAAVVEQEPGEGWALVVVELGDDPEIGLAVARRVRSELTAPVLVVAEPGSLPALDGAEFDDFVLAPVDPAELAVRIRRLAVGAAVSAPDEVISFKDLSLNLATYQATVGGEPIDLTYMEYELLRFFVTNPGRVWSREQLLNRVWGYDYFGGARTVDVHVRRLRAKLGEERSSWITTVRSVGYRFG
ncbi:MAG TPA: response regulator transcription factor [Acidimicrobiia bacterium]|nr:response regulator transcription factor [Acidimicrobiia bacterium]